MKYEEILEDYRNGIVIQQFNTYFEKWYDLPGIGSEGAEIKIADTFYADFRVKPHESEE